MSKLTVEKIIRFKGMNKAQLAFNVPKRLLKYTFDNFVRNDNNSENLDKCLEYVAGWPHDGGVIMLGGVGTGKTHLGVAICHELVKKNVTCHITTVANIVRDIREGWGKNGESEKQKIEAYTEYGLLLIDEIGIQYGSDSEKVIIGEIINNRYEEMLPTIAIGNVSGEEMKNVVGHRVVDRLIHDGIVLKFDWETLRLKK